MGTLRISWYSNAPWAPTGYGGQTDQVCTRLRQAGHPVEVIANFGATGIRTEWHGIPVHPTGYEAHSNDVLAYTHGEIGSDWLVTLYDAWVIDPAPLAGFRVASWLPVDHDPVPPRVAEWAANHHTIAMSRFGQEALRAKGITAAYVPHAVEPVFSPTPSDIRRALKVPEDGFLVTINAANKGNVPPRKGWNEMFSAFARFARKHPDAYLYVHTDALGNVTGGIDLRVLAVASGIPDDRLRWPPVGPYRLNKFGRDYLARVYSASSVLLATSMGEGFGIPVIEAQACGCPVIVTDATAQPELVGGGWTVRAQPYWDMTQGAFLAMPIIDDIVLRLEQSYEARGDETIRGAALAKGTEYDADAVFDEYWSPVLADMEAALVVKDLAIRPRKKKGKR